MRFDPNPNYELAPNRQYNKSLPQIKQGPKQRYRSCTESVRVLNQTRNDTIRHEYLSIVRVCTPLQSCIDLGGVCFKEMLNIADQSCPECPTPLQPENSPARHCCPCTLQQPSEMDNQPPRPPCMSASMVAPRNGG